MYKASFIFRARSFHSLSPRLSNRDMQHAGVSTVTVFGGFSE